MSHGQGRSSSVVHAGRRTALVAAFVAAGWSGAAAAQVAISGTSPYPDGGDPTEPVAVTACNGAPQAGVLYRNSEAEPHVAVNPVDPSNLIAGWHQDRWSNGGAQGLGAAYSRDGGATWTPVTIPFTRCSGAAARSTGDFERASDPWISFGPNGTAHYMALVTDHSVNANAMSVARSADGGATWSAPTLIARMPAQDPVKQSVFHDKNTITADPYYAQYVYATWTVFRTGITSLVFARSTNGGATWSPPVAIATMGAVARSEKAFFRQGAQVVVLPDGTLVNAFFRMTFDDANPAYRTEQVIVRSYDKGRTWTRPDTVVAPFVTASAVDPETGVPVRDAGGLPSLAVDPASGRLYLAWQDRDANTAGRVGVLVARSSDGGATWSAPVRVNQGTGAAVQAFLPMVAVNAQGTVGVLFYDFRNDVPGDAVLSTDVHLSLFDGNLNYAGERRLTTRSFDMRQMVITGSRGHFPGDYTGLAATGADFVAAFTAANDLGLPVAFPQADGLFVDTNDRQSIVFVRQTP